MTGSMREATDRPPGGEEDDEVKSFSRVENRIEASDPCQIFPADQLQ
jgi:hypothetical protein